MNKPRTAQELAKCVIKTIEKRGWCKYDLQNEGGNVCVLGGINLCMNGNAFTWGQNDRGPSHDLIMELIKDPTINIYKGKFLTHCDTIARWNNARATTKQDIIAALRKVANTKS